MLISLSESYEFLEPLGTGPIGRVDLVADSLSSQTFAMKTLAPELTQDPDVGTLFLEKALALSNLLHPNIVSVYEISPSIEEPFFTMDLLEGKDLEFVAYQMQTPSFDERFRILIEVAKALVFLHNQSIVHGNLKPANVRILTNGEVKITDLGMGEVMAFERWQKRLPNRANYFLSTERMQGKSPSQHSDLYAFGLMAYELLSHPKRLDRDSVAKIQTIGLVKAGLPSKLGLEDFDRVLEECLDPGQASKQVSAYWFLEALQKAKASIPKDAKLLFEVAAPKSTHRKRNVVEQPAFLGDTLENHEKSQKNKILLLVVVLGCGLLVLIGLSMYLFVKSPEEQKAPVSEPTQTPTPVLPPVEIAPPITIEPTATPTATPKPTPRPKKKPTATPKPTTPP